ncbi:glutaredoxin domain-containing protein [Rummeliibacillus sp. TYF-LIM-RU47]
MEIIVYTQPNCIYCENLVSFLEEKKVNYKEINIHKSLRCTKNSVN